jgi:hypothetical protein
VSKVPDVAGDKSQTVEHGNRGDPEVGLCHRRPLTLQLSPQPAVAERRIEIEREDAEVRPDLRLQSLEEIIWT